MNMTGSSSHDPDKNVKPEVAPELPIPDHPSIVSPLPPSFTSPVSEQPKQDPHERTYVPSRDTINVKSDESGPVNVVKELVNTQEVKDDDTLVDIKVANPLRKIVKILEEIKKKQSTTFSFRFTIPLIALPVFLFAAFQLGRVQSNCSPEFVSRIGTLRTLSVAMPKQSTGLISDVLSFMGISTQQKLNDFETLPKTILITDTDNPISVLHPESYPISSFEDQRVIITGNLSKCTDTLSLDSFQNISLY